MARVIAGASEPGNNRLMIVAALAFVPTRTHPLDEAIEAVDRE